VKLEFESKKGGHYGRFFHFRPFAACRKG